VSKADAGPKAKPGRPGKVDILWGWQEIAEALQVSVCTAKRLADEEGLPVFTRRGRMAQSSRQALQKWANGEPCEDGEGGKS